MNLTQIRQDTPGIGTGIFLNSAGASLPAAVVNEAVIEYLQAEELIGGYGLHAQKSQSIGAFYSSVAQLINTQPHNLAFASSATDAYAKALSSIPFETGDVILTSDDDYVSNYIQFINLKKRYGICIVRMANLENGDLNLTRVAEQIDTLKPKLVALTHIPTNSGLVQDVEAVGALCRAANSLYLVDACQSVGQMPVDVASIQCDFLSVTGRKFLRAPRGTGFLYVHDRVLSAGLHPLAMDSADATWTEAEDYQFGGSAKRFEFWEKPYALLMGITAAVDYANTLGLDQIQYLNQKLSQQLRADLAAIKGLFVLDRGTHKSNIITLRKEGVSKDDTLSMLKKHDISAGISLRQHAVIDYDKKGFDWALRLSPHYFNTPEELQKVCEAIEDL